MLRKLLNTILLINGVSTPEDDGTNCNDDKWAERRKRYGDKPWEERRLSARKTSPPENKDVADDR